MTVPAPPESFLQLAQWHMLRVSGASESSNCTAPQRQLPCKVAIGRAYTRAISRRDFVLLLVDALFSAAAGYELAVALGWISMGPQAGDDARGQALATIAAVAALALGIGSTAFAAHRERRRGSLAAVVVPVSAAAYLTAHFYAFDSYYLPSLRRFSDSGSVSAIWIYGVVVAASAVGALIWRRPREGLILAPVILLVCAVTVVGLGTGH